MVGMKSHPNVELILAGGLDQVFVTTNTTCLQGFGTQLLVLIGDEMDTEGKVVDAFPLLS
jgi:hypothetical protein